MASSSVQTAHYKPATLGAPLLQRLREETADMHDSLHRALELTRPNLRLNEYRRIVERIYGFHSPWEARIESTLCRHLPEFEEDRRKAPRLQNDLDYLSVDYGNLRVCSRLPDHAAWPAVLGSLYFIEGSTLGWHIQARAVEQSLGLTAREGAAFLTGYGMQTVHRWRHFCQLLSASTHSDDEDALVSGAHRAYEAMRDWLI